jgi:hypothetical protein
MWQQHWSVSLIIFLYVLFSNLHFRIKYEYIANEDAEQNLELNSCTQTTSLSNKYKIFEQLIFKWDMVMMFKAAQQYFSYMEAVCCLGRWNRRKRCKHHMQEKLVYCCTCLQNCAWIYWIYVSYHIKTKWPSWSWLYLIRSLKKFIFRYQYLVEIYSVSAEKIISDAFSYSENV